MGYRWQRTEEDWARAREAKRERTAKDFMVATVGKGKERTTKERLRPYKIYDDTVEYMSVVRAKFGEGEVKKKRVIILYLTGCRFPRNHPTCFCSPAAQRRPFPQIPLFIPPQASFCLLIGNYWLSYQCISSVCSSLFVVVGWTGANRTTLLRDCLNAVTE